MNQKKVDTMHALFSGVGSTAE